jgi:flavin reductase (DIM6/NTAB) family NADH-FMN oxidoreductase RutF
VRTHHKHTECPLLEGALGTFECERFAAHEAGDHVILLGRVVALSHHAEGEPLLYFRGRYALIGPHGPVIGPAAPE